MAKSPTEHVRELNLEVRALAEREAALRTLVSDLRAADEQRREEIAELRRNELGELRQELALVRQENAVLRQQLQDHIRQVELWDGRRWGLFVLLIGAVLSLASGLIVTLAKR